MYWQYKICPGSPAPMICVIFTALSTHLELFEMEGGRDTAAMFVDAGLR
jgi:hypothetical protein